MAPGIIQDEVPVNGTSEPTKAKPIVAVNGESHIAEEFLRFLRFTMKHAEEQAKVEEKKTGEEKKDADETKTNGEDKKTDADKKDDEEKDKKDGEQPKDETMKCEIKHLDRRYDEKDEQYFAERKIDIEKPKQKDWWRLYAFCLVKHYDSDGDLDCTRLYVNDQPLRQLLKDVIGNYPSDPIDVDDVQIDAPYHSLFHYRKQLSEVGLERFKDEPDNLAQLKLLLDWINKHFELDIAAYERCVSAEDVKAIPFDHLWTLFPPGKIVHCKLLEQNRAFRISRYWDEYDEHNQICGLNLSVKFIDFDGDNLGTRKTHLYVAKYAGTQEISELCVSPLDLLEDADEVRAGLLERGRKFESFLGQHFLQYNAIAVKKKDMGYGRINVSGRVMIDCKTYHRLDPNDSFVVTKLESAVAAEKKKRRAANAENDFVTDEPVFEKLTDEEAMLTNATVRGYSFSQKLFLEFFVDKLKPIEWNSNCFDSLVLDPSIKKTVQALVSTHTRKRENSFDDIVKGKGQGLVCVLHGPPGVGKTLTAECVAEYVKRPLYMVSSGDLGTHSAELDRELTRIMDMTATWRAVLLIDEADIFLERRSLHDLHRNAMVSVFLRVLEYYGGILFLTTNRVNTFDDAFKSRIHIPIRYTDLSFDSRLKIWRNFCKMVPGGVDIDEAGLAKLAEHDLNGRQIKNAIKAAESLAQFDEVKLDLEQLLQVTKIQAVFEKDLSSLTEIDYTVPGESKRRDAETRNMFF